MGRLALSDGRFDLTTSTWEKQQTGYFGFGFDLDPEGRHTLDTSVFYTKKDEEAVQLKEDGYFPNFDYGGVAALEANGDDILPSAFTNFATIGTWVANNVRTNAFDGILRGHLWRSNFGESVSVDRDRDLVVYQANGAHEFAQLEGLRVTWAANHAKTTQDETRLAGAALLRAHRFLAAGAHLLSGHRRQPRPRRVRRERSALDERFGGGGEAELCPPRCDLPIGAVE